MDNSSDPRSTQRVTTLKGEGLDVKEPERPANIRSGSEGWSIPRGCEKKVSEELAFKEADKALKFLTVSF